ncbi:MAG: STAS/SEC14 domain-containing protein [Alphaproteobacteria bacterium]|nr:STAS/SEC14 domain-containing protein [Alphaproteobacteria bacterium]
MPAPLFEETYQDDSVRFTVTLDEAFVFGVGFIGKGTIEGTHAFIRMVGACGDIATGRGHKLRGTVDLSRMNGAPLRVQLILSKWLLGQRDAIDRVAVCGGGRFERKLAKAVTSAARLSSVRFFDGVAEAEGWVRG